MHNCSASATASRPTSCAANADRSQLLDMRTWAEADGIAFDHDARPDGLHFTAEAARYVSETWLGPSLMSVVT